MWLIRGQWIAIASLGVFGLLAHLSHFVDTIWPLLGVVAVAAIHNVMFSRVPHVQNRPRAAARYSLCFDILTLTLFLHYSGDLENPLSFAYVVPIVAGAILLSLRSAIGLSLLATLLYSMLIICTHFDFAPIHIRHHHLALLKGVRLHEKFDPDTSGEGWGYLVGNMGAFAVILFGSALGSGALSKQVRRQREEIQMENQRMTLLLSILPDGVVLIARDGKVVIDSGAARKLFPSLSGGTIHELDPDLRLADRLAHLAEEFIRFESHLGERILEHAIARASPDGPYVWVFHDITHQRRLIAQVIHQSKMVDLGLLAAGIAHEIGNPLSSMAAVIEVLEMRQTAPDLVERLRSLRTHVDRIDRIVKDVTGFARPSEGQKANVDASALVAKAIQIFRLHERSRGITVDAPQIRAPAIIRAIEDQIVQVLLNILLNAADASGGKGEIRVETRCAGGQVEIDVTDHGAGMDEETRLRIFTPFFTTKEPGKGVGLGLFVSESIVHMHSGHIRVTSAHGQGSTFTISLPLVDGA